MADAIKLTNEEVLASSGAMRSLGQLKLPVKAAYAIAKAGNKLMDLSTTIREVQQKLWEKHGEKDEAGKLKVDSANQTITIPADSREAFAKEHDDLMAEANEITGLRKITLSELGDAKVEPSILGQLEWFIKDE